MTSHRSAYRSAFAFCLLWLLAGPATQPSSAQQAGSEEAGPEAYAERDPELEARVREIASQLRCPTCRSLSVNDSPSDMALEMRDLIREQLRAGKSREEVTAYFVDRYGEWILLKPKARGLNWAVWILPVVLVFGGLAFVLLTARRWVERGKEEATLIDNSGPEV